MTHMAMRHRLIAIDHPGIGASPPCGPQSIPTIVEQVAHLMDEFGIEQFSVVGHSTGGLVAQALALDHATRINRVVLSSTWAKPDLRFRDLFRLRQQVLRHAGSEAYVMLGQLLAFPSDWYETNMAKSDAPAFNRLSGLNVSLALERIDMLLGYQRAEELHRIKQPTLVVGAKDDNIVPFSHSEDLASRISQAQLAELSGGHFSSTTRTADYVRLVAAFLGDSL